MSADPFRRPPMIDVSWGEKQRWWQHATQWLAERQLWSAAQSLADQAHAQLADAINKIDEAQQQAAAALAEFEGVAQRL